MNFNELKKTQAAVVTGSGMTLADLMGKKTILPLPEGLHEVDLVEVTSTAESKALRITVEKTDTKTQHSVVLNVGNTPEQADIFLSIVSHLLDQLDMATLDIDEMKTKIGATIMVLATAKVSERGTFINYSFNPAVMLNHME